MSNLRDRGRALPEVIAITSDEIGRIDKEEHRLDGVDPDAENEVLEVKELAAEVDRESS